MHVDFEEFERVLRNFTRNTPSTSPRKNPALMQRRSKRSPKWSRPPALDFSSHNWRSVTSGISHGWSVARALFMLNALLGAVATEGGVFPNAWNKFVPKPIHTPPHPKMWGEMNWPRSFRSRCTRCLFCCRIS